MFALRSFIKHNVPADGLIVIGMCLGVYAFGVNTATNKVKAEVVVTPAARSNLRERMESKFGAFLFLIRESMADLMSQTASQSSSSSSIVSLCC
jgi:hypothetical protein